LSGVNIFTRIQILYVMKTCYSILLLLVLFLSCKKTDSSGLGELPNNLNNRSVGASANELLSSQMYSSLQVEINYMPGFQPDNAALDHITNSLNGLINKPGGIVFTQKQIPASGKSSLSVTEIANIEKSNRTKYNSGNTATIYLLITDGNYTEPNVLGIAYRNTSMCLFGKKIHDNSGGLGQASRTKLEATVLKHEFGHLFGLVDLGSAMQVGHKDAAHGNHCNNQSCLMYYASETTDILGYLVTGSIPDFDANCKNDMKANGGK
jgi:predicted Zn-dependent protease